MSPSPSGILRVIAIVLFILSGVGVTLGLPIALLQLGLACWCASSLV